MIQRIQSVWLMLCIIAMALMAYIPSAYYNKSDAATGDKTLQPILANYNLLMIVLVALPIVIAGFALFSFKNRKTQKLLCLSGFATSVLSIVYLFYLVKSFQSGNAVMNFGIALPIASCLFFILAYFGIQKDDKLVKSLDRLR